MERLPSWMLVGVQAGEGVSRYQTGFAPCLGPEIRREVAATIRARAGVDRSMERKMRRFKPLPDAPGAPGTDRETPSSSRLARVAPASLSSPRRDRRRLRASLEASRSSKWSWIASLLVGEGPPRTRPRGARTAACVVSMNRRVYASANVVAFSTPSSPAVRACRIRNASHASTSARAGAISSNPAVPPPAATPFRGRGGQSLQRPTVDIEQGLGGIPVAPDVARGGEGGEHRCYHRLLNRLAGHQSGIRPCSCLGPPSISAARWRTRRRSPCGPLVGVATEPLAPTAFAVSAVEAPAIAFVLQHLQHGVRCLLAVGLAFQPFVLIRVVREADDPRALALALQKLDAILAGLDVLEAERVFRRGPFLAGRLFGLRLYRFGRSACPTTC